MNKISVAIATYNEEKNIGRCLESVSGWVDEIVIVDGKSTDKTVEIAKKYKAKVITTDNRLNFHINKQKAISECRGEWILQLDADEVVTDELKGEIIKVISQRPTTNLPADATHQALQAGDQRPINGYWIPRKNYFLGRFLMKGGQYPDYTLRLYRKGKGRLPCKSVHEQAAVEGEVGYLSHPLLHYPYADFSNYMKKAFHRYTNFMAFEFRQSKLSINIKTFFIYLFVKPVYWFTKTYIRHKGFLDGFSGFIFSFFSALHYPVAYIKYWKIKSRQQ